MKLIKTLVIVQTIMTLILSVVVLSTISKSPIATSRAFDAVLESSNTNTPFEADYLVERHNPQMLEDILRRVVHDELGKLTEAVNQPRPDGTSEKTAVSHSATDAAKLADDAEQRIAYFSSVGKINAAEMEMLLVQIEELNESDYHRMMSQLIAALNQRQIDGYLR